MTCRNLLKASSIDLRARIQAFVRAFGPMALPHSPLYNAQMTTFLTYQLDQSKTVVLDFTGELPFDMSNKS